jgi:hypothetical protein
MAFDGRAVHARQRREPGFPGVAADLAGESELVEPSDLAFPFDPGGMVGRKPPDQRSDPGPELKREVGRRCPHQLANVLDGDRMVFAQAIRILRLTHFCGTASSRLST